MDELDWNVEQESQLLAAMISHKPVGVNKYFQMAFICDKMTESVKKEVDSLRLWQRLGTMYNLEALDESEIVPFPNTEKEFVLPDADFGTLLTKKEETKIPPQKATGGRETPIKIKETKKDVDKTPTSRNAKERRDSKDAKDAIKTPASNKKDMKKEEAKPKSAAKSRSSTAAAKIAEDKTGKNKNEDTPKPVKRPTRGSLNLKSNDDSGSSGKSSPVTVAPIPKRRRI